MLKTFILEDEAKAIRLLKRYVQQVDFLSLVGSARRAEVAAVQLDQTPVDLLFLDINLPDHSGIEFYKELDRPPAVIFTTAYPEFAVQGFDLEAIDYLLKPITFPRFFKACKRAVQKQENTLLSTLKSSKLNSDVVYIKSGTILHKVDWQDILFLQKDENYVIYHTNKKRILSRQTLNDLERIFPDYFLRIHKSYAVNLLHLKQICRETLSIDEQQLPIGRTYKNQLLMKIRSVQES